MLVIISVPTLALLFLQNKQVQTTLSDYLTDLFSEKLEVEVSVSAVHYNFFKRLQVYNLYMADRNNDTLMYAEVAKARIKKFRPDKKDIQIRNLSFDNAYFQIRMDENGNSSLEFLVDSLKRNLPPEEKVVLQINKMEFTDSRFRRVDEYAPPTEQKLDLADLDVRELNGQVRNFLFKLDTLYMSVDELSGQDKSGMRISEVGFNLTTDPNFMTFSEGWLNTEKSSANIPVIDFRYSNPKNFKYFFDSIDIYISSANSMMDFEDLGYLFPQVENLDGKIQVDGSVYGTFGDMKGENIFINYMDNTRLHFDFALAGLEVPDSMYMDFSFKEFITKTEELKALLGSMDIDFLEDSIKYASVKALEYTGKFNGYLHDFNTEGELRTNLGDLLLALNMRPDSTQGLRFEGNLLSSGLELGTLIHQEDDIGRVSFNINVNGINIENNFSGNISGAIDSIGILAYDYTNLQLSGAFSNRKFDGQVEIRDPNIGLNFTGSLDFEKEQPHFDFTLDVPKLRPYYLHLREDDPEYFASFLLKTSMTGINLNELNGNIQLVNSFFKRTGSQIQLYDALLTTGNMEDSSFIKLNSDFLDAEIIGQYDLRSLPAHFTNLLNRHFAIIPEQERMIDTVSNYAFNMHLKDVNPLLDFFFPDYTVSKDIQVSGEYIPGDSSYTFYSEGSVPYLAFKQLQFHHVNFDIQADTSRMYSEIMAETLEAEGGFEIKETVINSQFSRNSNDLNITWDNDTLPEYSGNINTRGKIRANSDRKLVYSLEMLPSHFFYDGKEFDLPGSFLTFSPDGIAIDSFLVSGEEQYFLAHGNYTDRKNDSITFNLENFNLHIINDLSKSFKLNLEGSLSGYNTLRKSDGRPVFSSDLNASNLVINEQIVGDANIAAQWIQNRGLMELEVHTLGDSANIIHAAGTYKPRNNGIDLDVDLFKLNMVLLEPYLENVISDVEGYADIRLSLDGFLDKPLINGSADLINTALTVNSTRVRYMISDQLRIYRNDLYFDNFEVFDQYNNLLTAKGNITTANFSNVILNLDLDATNFNFLATDRIDNEQFYGDIFASATARIRGSFDDLNITANATTNRYTNFKLPLYNASKIQSADFITFVQTKDIDEVEEFNRPAKDNPVKFDMELNINNNALVQLIFDPKVGDIIEASGSGTLILELDEYGDFHMFGDVYIQDGDYLFTVENVINKRFRVKPGGSISWNGSPTSANINLEAIYETKASIYSLLPLEEREEASKKRIPVNCLLTLEGELSKPGIKPTIELPNAEPQTRDRVETNIGTEEDLMRQFISLLVINSFINTEGTGSSPISGMAAGGVAGVTASELLSNQLTNWLSQLSNDFDIGVNYRPGDDVSSEEIEVALSTQLLNDRIIFSGNLDVVRDEEWNNQTNQASNIVGDFDLEFIVTNKISLKAFNRVNDDMTVRSSIYTQGVGIQYKNEFNTLKDLFSRRKKKKEEQETPREENAIKEENTDLEKDINRD